MKDILLGVYNTADIQNVCVLDVILSFAKKFIYRHKVMNQIPVFQNFVLEFVNYFHVEKSISYRKCEWNNFDERWKLYMNLLE